MKWTRRHLTFANVISMMALFVALGGAGYAAVTLPKNSITAKQIKKNAVGASEIKRNGVGAAEVKTNAIAAAEIRSSAVGSVDLADSGVAAADIADNAVGAGEIADNAVGTGEVADNALTGADVADGSLEAEVGPDAFARVQADGTLSGGTPEQSKGLVAASVQHQAGAPTDTVTGDGVYCFGGLGFTPRTAVVTLDGADTLPAPPSLAATSNKVVAVAVQRGSNLSRCDADHQQARVSILQVNDTAAPVLVNHGFVIWFER
jgi:hypothetical protein